MVVISRKLFFLSTLALQNYHRTLRPTEAAAPKSFDFDSKKVSSIDFTEYFISVYIDICFSRKILSKNHKTFCLHILALSKIVSIAKDRAISRKNNNVLSQNVSIRRCITFLSFFFPLYFSYYSRTDATDRSRSTLKSLDFNS